ncbi:MAG: T9SS type A sorting domain-containing protein [Bacteroidia bacterium]
MGGKLIGIQNQRLEIQARGDTTVYASNRTRLLHPFRVGVNQAPTSYFNQLRGLQFNVEQTLIIEEVTMFAQNHCTFRVMLQDGNGNTIHSLQAESPPNIGLGIPFTVHLDFEVEPGTNYRLVADNIQGGNLGFLNPGPLYPLSYPGVMEITRGITISTAYYYFFDWVISKAACEGPRVPKNISVSLPLNLPETLYACDDTMLVSGIAASSYQWNTNETTPDIVVDSSGTYILTVTDGANCTVSDTTVFTRATPVGLAADGVLCGRTLNTNYGANAVFLWNTSDTTPTITLVDTGRYSVTIVEPRGCVLQDSIHVTDFADFPVVNLGNDRSVCVQDTLNAGNPGSTYLWSTNATTQTIVARSTGFYSVSVTNTDGCTASDTIALTVTPKPTADFGNNITNFQVCFLNFSSFGNYAWSFGDGGTDNAVQPCHTYVDTGTYTVRLIVTNQCGSDTMIQTVRITRPNGLESDLTTLRFSIHPNPANDQFSIILPDTHPGAESNIEILSLEGKVLVKKEVSGQPEPVSVDQLATGMYLLRIRQGNKLGIAKLQVIR